MAMTELFERILFVKISEIKPDDFYLLDKNYYYYYYCLYWYSLCGLMSSTWYTWRKPRGVSIETCKCNNEEEDNSPSILRDKEYFKGVFLFLLSLARMGQFLKNLCPRRRQTETDVCTDSTLSSALLSQA